MGKIIKWSFLGMATICGAGRGIVETHFNSMPPWDGATSCSMLVLGSTVDLSRLGYHEEGIWGEREDDIFQP